MQASNGDGEVDISMIPSALISRVEVVTGGASAAYGSNAVAGVVNFVLDDKLDKTNVTLQYGRPERSEGQQYFASIGTGTGFASGRGHVVFGFDYTDDKGVPSPYDRQVGADETSIAELGTDRPAGLPARIIAPHMEFATFTPGGIIVGGPLDGTAFMPGGTPYALNRAGLIPTSGMMISTANPRANEFANAPLSIPFKRYAALTHMSYDVTDSTQGWLQLNFGQNESGFWNEVINSPGSTNPEIIIPLDNPFLPKQIRDQMVANGLTSITMDRFNRDFGAATTHIMYRQYGGDLGFKTELTEKWSIDGYYQHEETNNDARLMNIEKSANFAAALYAVQTPNGIACGPAATNPILAANPSLQSVPVDPGCIPFNPFGQHLGANELLANQRNPDPSIRYILGADQLSTDHLVQDIGAFNLHGRPFATWAGPVPIAAGVEYRRDFQSVKVDPISNAYAAGNRGPSEGSLTVAEGYLETAVPLVSGLALAKSLALNGATRITRYNIGGTVNTWKLGIDYQMTDDVRFRATRSRDIRAPNYSELLDVQITSIGRGIVNPVNGQAADIPSLSVPNGNLKPEQADTWTAGVVWQDSDWRFSTSLDYYDITINGVIVSPDEQTLVNNCLALKLQVFCPFVNLDPTATNGIASVAQSFFNLDSQKTNGVDFELAYSPQVSLVPGEFKIRTLANWIDHFSITDQGITVDRIGEVVPKWNVNAQADYRLKNLTITSTATWKSGRLLDATYRDPSDPGYVATDPNSINKNHFPSAWYLNMGFSYNFGGLIPHSGAQFVLFGNVNNVLDRAPPWGATYAANGFGGTQYDLIGRAYKLGVRLSF
jgi:outer membrane receptor protein involved in Fe transport